MPRQTLPGMKHRSRCHACIQAHVFELSLFVLFWLRIMLSCQFAMDLWILEVHCFRSPTLLAHGAQLISPISRMLRFETWVASSS